MEKFKLNGDGFIKPIERINISHEEFEQFSCSFKNVERDKLLATYNYLIDTIKEMVNDEFVVWIGGSFASGKKAPNDIDMCVFLTKDDRKDLQDLIEEVYKIMDVIKIDIDFRSYIPNVDFTDDELTNLKSNEMLFYNRRIDGIEVKERCSGFFEINY